MNNLTKKLLNGGGRQQESLVGWEDNKRDTLLCFTRLIRTIGSVCIITASQSLLRLPRPPLFSQRAYLDTDVLRGKIYSSKDFSKLFNIAFGIRIIDCCLLSDHIFF
jgi:hypothetical protein